MFSYQELLDKKKKTAIRSNGTHWRLKICRIDLMLDVKNTWQIKDFFLNLNEKKRLLKLKEITAQKTFFPGRKTSSLRRKASEFGIFQF
jgi:hypothetical protein